MSAPIPEPTLSDSSHAAAPPSDDSADAWREAWRRAAHDARQGHERIAEQLRHRQAIHALAMMDHVDLEASVRLTVERLAEALGVARVSIWLYNADRTEIACVGLLSQGAYSDRRIELSSVACPQYFNAIRESRLIDASHAQTDARTAELREHYLVPLGITSLLDVALIVGGEPIGVVCAEHVGAERTWSDAEADLMTSSAALLAIAFAIEHRRSLQDQLRQSQKMEAVGLLAGGIAHDVNNVLNIVLGEADLLDDESHDPTAIREGLANIREAAKKAAGLTHKLLTFSRQRAVALTPIDLNAVVGDFERMSRRVAGEAVRVVLRSSPVPLPVLADATLLEQVLLNLVVNARQAMPDGGDLVITASAIPAGALAVDASGDEAKAYACITIADTGVGMDADVVARIWEPFFTTRELGSGLGLSIVHGAVRQMRGFATVESAPGRGTTFALHFPLTGEYAAQAAAEVHERPSYRSSVGRILLAEDDPQVRRVLALVLRRAGLTVTEAQNGEEALNLFVRHPLGYDLLVSDVAMPVLDGPSAYRRMRTMRSGFPALFLTGYAPETMRVETLGRDGAPVRWLSKPVAREVLLAAVGELLGKRAPLLS
ncbi:MAG: ATP-binding protein [Gemmatimonadaceae bacterium]